MRAKNHDFYIHICLGGYKGNCNGVLCKESVTARTKDNNFQDYLFKLTFVAIIFL